jgi:hypothetical protein
MDVRRSRLLAAPVLLLLLGGACSGERSSPREARPASTAGKDSAKDKGKKKKVPPRTKPAEAPDIADLNLEVTALQVLHHLQPTPAQLKRLARLARSTASSPPRKEIKVSDKFRQKLTDLRDALAGGGDDEKIDELFEALDKLREKEEPDFDEVEVTDEARKEAPGLLRDFGARQVVGYLAAVADEFPDPTERLLAALERSRKLRGQEWRNLRDDVAYQVGWLLAGLDSRAETKVREQVAKLLTDAYRLEDKEFKARQSELEKQVRALTARAEPTDVVRHFMQRTLAELLSNPRLGVALAALQKKGK